MNQYSAVLVFFATLVPVLACGDEITDPTLAKVATWRANNFAPSFRLPTIELGKLVEKLNASPDGASIRIETAIIASALARDATSPTLNDKDRVAVTSLAWTLLVSGHVLREGMTLEQVVAIIGKPSSIDDLGNHIWISSGAGARQHLSAEFDTKGRSVSFMSTFK